MNEMQVAADAAHMYRRLRSGDLSGVQQIFRDMPDEQLPMVVSHINLNLGLDRMSSKGSTYEGRIRDMLDILMDIYQDRVYVHSMLDNIGDLKTYPEYQEYMVSLGKDPLTYHEWEEAVFKPAR